jgi:hypothetical protein
MPNTVLRAVPPLRSKLAIALVAVALLPVAGRVALHAWRNHPPDNWREVRSPDGNYRVIITEEGVRQPGGNCQKDMYVVHTADELDRDDEDSHVFRGACGALLDVSWSGHLVEARVDHRAAVLLRHAAAGGKVKLHWSS